MTRIVGIDPGQDVALCLLESDRSRAEVRFLRSPERGVDELGLVALLRVWAPDCAVIERVGVMPGQGATSSATFMVAWGVIRGICAGLRIPYTLVTPQSWKRAVLVGMDMGPEIVKGLPRDEDRALRGRRKAAQKASAIAWVRREFPTVSLVPARARVDNHNLAEAVCLACYGAGAS